MSYYPGMYTDEQAYNDEQEYLREEADLEEEANLRQLMEADWYDQLHDPDYYDG